VAALQSILVVGAGLILGLAAGIGTALLIYLVREFVGSVTLERWLRPLLIWRRAQRESRADRLNAPWSEVWTVAEELADSDRLLEQDVQRLRQAARQLPDLDFLDPIYRQRRLGTEQGS